MTDYTTEDFERDVLAVEAFKTACECDSCKAQRRIIAAYRALQQDVTLMAEAWQNQCADNLALNAEIGGLQQENASLAHTLLGMTQENERLRDAEQEDKGIIATYLKRVGELTAENKRLREELDSRQEPGWLDAAYEETVAADEAVNSNE